MPSCNRRVECCRTYPRSVMRPLKIRTVVRLVVALFLVGIVLRAGRAEPSTTTAKPDEREISTLSTTGPTGILIMAQGRSGSTMLGELFRQNKDVLYWYEPCRGRNEKGKSKVDTQCLKLVRRLTQCSFSKEDAVWLLQDPIALENGSPVLEVLLNASGRDELARAHSTVVDYCKKSRAVVTKVIRLGEGLGGPENDVSGLLVLQLVRDPRGVVRSQRQNFKHTWGADAKASSVATAKAGGRNVCEVYSRQLESSSKVDDNRYLRVRYEDLATSPMNAVETIYGWSKLLPVPPRVSTWIEKNTNIETCERGANRSRKLRIRPEGSSFGYYATSFGEGGDERRGNLRGERSALASEQAGVSSSRALAAKKNNSSGGSPGARVSPTGGAEGSKCHENTKQASENPYGTKRHSATMVGMWRTQMSEEDAAAIWNVCKKSGVMDALGYAP